MGSYRIKTNQLYRDDYVSFYYDVNLHNHTTLWVGFDLCMDQFRIKGEYWFYDTPRLEITFNNHQEEKYSFMLQRLIEYLCRFALAIDPWSEHFKSAVENILHELVSPMF